MNSGLGIITVKKVDLVTINKGFPGPITFKSLELFSLRSRKSFE